MSSEWAVLDYGEAKSASARVDTRRVHAHVSLPLGNVFPKCALHFIRGGAFSFVAASLIFTEPHTLRITGDSVEGIQRRGFPLLYKITQII